MATRALSALDGPEPQPQPAPHMALVAGTALPHPDAPAPRRLTARAATLGGVVALHAAVFAALVLLHVGGTFSPPPEAMLFVDVPMAAPPPPAEAPKLDVVTPPVVIPPPVFELAERPPAITAEVVDTPPPPDAAPAPAAAIEGPPGPPAPRAPATLSGGDLSATMIEAVPPKYPYESRRLKEQGTVVLDVVLGADGRVERLSVQTSSGHARLDKAALDAVRRWRWSPTVRDGVAVPVRGIVPIPFTLTPRA